MSLAGYTWPWVANHDRKKGRPNQDGIRSAEHGDTLCIELRLVALEPDPPLSGWLDVELLRLAQLAGISKGLLGVVVVNDAEMIRLHTAYRNKPETTDVLTFNMNGYFEKPPNGLGQVPLTGTGTNFLRKIEPVSLTWVEGDVVVCLDEAARQASVRAHPLRHEVLLYALHGLLHLLGYDDVAPQDARKMHMREDELLVAAGLGRVYASTQTKDGGER